MSRFLLSIPEAAEALSIGTTKMRELVALGVVPAVSCGRRRLIHVDDLEAYAQSLRNGRGLAVVRDVAS